MSIKKKKKKKKMNQKGFQSGRKSINTKFLAGEENVSVYNEDI